ncbi:SDR family oxidoreductase [Mucilaginibacter sp.]
MKILVTGSTGPLGGAVVKTLLAKTEAANISILARSAEKAVDLKAKGVKVNIGDYNNYASLVAAFTGVEKIYFVSGNDIPNRIPQHENVINAAKEAGVKHVFYTSTQRKNETPSSPIYLIEEAHLDTENKLKASGLKYTFLQHTLYADIIPNFAGEHLLDMGTLVFPAADGKTTFALREDLAEAGANLLLDETGKYENKAVVLTGATGVTWAEVAAAISEIIGKQIGYASPSQEEYIAALNKAGVPEIFVHMLSGFAEAIKQGEFDQVDSEFENILGRKPAPFTDLLKVAYGKK